MPRGRRPGCQKTGGRKKGTPNKTKGISLYVLHREAAAVFKAMKCGHLTPDAATQMIGSLKQLAAVVEIANTTLIMDEMRGIEARLTALERANG